MYIVSIIFIIFCIILFLFIKYYYNKPIKVSDDIVFNLKNKDKLINFFISEIDKRINLLRNKSYEEWINYNKMNPYIKYNNHKYYFFIYELSEESKYIEVNFINRLNQDKEIENMSYQDIIKKREYEFVFSKYKTDYQLIKNMYFNNKSFNDINYYWYDPELKIITRKHSITKNFKKNDIKGLIGIGFNIEDITDEQKINFYNLIDKTSLYILIILIFIVSIIMSLFDDNNLKITPIIFLLIIYIYIIYYLSQKSEFSSFKIEENKFKFLSDSILSASFLIGINVFILNSIQKYNNKKKNILFINSTILFALSLILLLRTLFRKTNYDTVEEMKIIRTTYQLFFNCVVIINAFIIINYFFYILASQDKKIYKIICNLFFK